MRKHDGRGGEPHAARDCSSLPLLFMFPMTVPPPFPSVCTIGPSHHDFPVTAAGAKKALAVGDGDRAVRRMAIGCWEAGSVDPTQQYKSAAFFTGVTPSHDSCFITKCSSRCRMQPERHPMSRKKKHEVDNSIRDRREAALCSRFKHHRAGSSAFHNFRVYL